MLMLMVNCSIELNLQKKGFLFSQMWHINYVFDAKRTSYNGYYLSLPS